MSLHRRNPKRDSNEREIIDELIRNKCASWQLSHTGLPDLLCATPCGKLFLIEVKSPKGKLTPAQEQFFDAWRDVPAFVASDPAHVASIVRQVTA